VSEYQFLESLDLATDDLIVEGVKRILASLGRTGDERTFEVFDAALTGSMTKSEWRAVVLEAIRDRDPKRIWWSPGQLLVLLDRLRAEAALVGDSVAEAAVLEAIEDERRK